MKAPAKFVYAVLIALALMARAHAVIDLTDVTDGLTALDVAVLAAIGGPIAIAMGWQAIKFGGPWIIRVFKSFAR